MRWHLVANQSWKPAHTPWDEPVEIDTVWHEASLPPSVHTLPEHRWSRHWDAEHETSAPQRAQSPLRAWLRRLTEVRVRRPTGATVVLDGDGYSRLR